MKEIKLTQLEPHTTAHVKEAILDFVISLAAKYKLSLKDAYTLFNMGRKGITLYQLTEYNHGMCDCEKTFNECPYEIEKQQVSSD